MGTTTGGGASRPPKFGRTTNFLCSFFGRGSHLLFHVGYFPTGLQVRQTDLLRPAWCPHIDYTYSYNDWQLAWAIYVTCNRLSTVRPIRKTPQHRLSPLIESTSSNFIFKFTMLTAKTHSYFAVKIAWSYLQLFCRNTLALHTTDDRLIPNYAWNSKGIPLYFIVKLNMKITEVYWYFIAKTA